MFASYFCTSCVDWVQEWHSDGMLWSSGLGVNKELRILEASGSGAIFMHHLVSLIDASTKIAVRLRFMHR